MRGERRAGKALRASAVALQLGVLAAALAVVPFKAFELDRFFIPKELVLHATAAAAGVLALVGVRRLELTRVDFLLVTYLALSLLSALFADNWWLASRALAVSASSAVLFWSARRVAAHGLARGLVGAAMMAVGLVAAAALLQAYGMESRYMSLNRAPGGVLGNRNFVAHLVVFGLPAMLWFAIEARTAAGMVVGVPAMMAGGAALVLSRSRAAWLAALILAPIIIVTAVRVTTQWTEPLSWRRTRVLLAAAALGVVAAVVVPNTLDWRSDSPYLDSVRGLVDYDRGSGHGRLVQYRNSWAMARAHPVLGVGPGNWPVVYPAFARRGDPSLDADRMTANPWPSSDWVAMVSERGVAATIVLLIAFGMLAGQAAAALFTAGDRARAVAGGALLGVIAVALVVGSLDAFLLLGLPSLIAWTLIGALAPAGRTRWAVTLSPRAAHRLTMWLAVVWILVTARSATELVAMSAYSNARGVAGLARAARWDPGSYRIRLRLAQGYARRGDCARARSHARAAQEMFPLSPEPRRVLAVCGARRTRGP